MLPVAYLQHQVKGRARLKIPSRRGDKSFFAATADRLRSAPGVRTVRPNPQTGTILIHYTGEIDAAADFAKERGLFELSRTANPAAGATPSRKSRVRTAAVKLADPRLLAAGFVGLGAYRAARGRYFGNAVENLWNGYQLTKFQKRQGWATVFFSIAALQLVGGRALGAASSLLFYALTADHMAKINKPKSMS